MKKEFKVKFLKEEYPAFYAETVGEALGLLSRVNTDNLIGLDTETAALPEYAGHLKAGLSPLISNIRLIQLFDGETSVVLDIHKIGTGILPFLVKFLESHHFVAHNAIFDMQFLMRLGVRQMNLGCTLILAKLLFHAIYPTDDGLKASLQHLTNELFGTDLIKELQASDWSLPLTFEQIEYSALDAVCVLKIAERLAPGLKKYGLERIYRLTKEAQWPIAWMQLNGLGFDVKRHNVLINRWREDLIEARRELVKITGMEEFTGHKIGAWLESNLPKETLEVWPRTESGKLATDAHVFADFNYLPIVKPFSKFQKAVKLTTTYGPKLTEAINPATKKLHSRFNLLGARTGRLSCSEPNLQQAPRDKDFRSCFIPSEGKVFVCADYSQIEIRVAAELSRDETMLEAYRQGIDIHTLMAAKISKKPLSKVTKEDRQRAKASNFGFMFGLGAKKFAHYAKKSYGVEVSEEEAHDAVNAFRTLYAGYRDWQLKQADNSAQGMTVSTPCGKLRRLNTDNCYGGSMNTPVQGGAAEVMLHALVFLYHTFINEPEVDARLVNCVHDEVLIECPLKWAKLVQEIVVECMTNAFLAVFPSGITKDLVSINVGASWGEAK